MTRQKSWRNKLGDIAGLKFRRTRGECQVVKILLGKKVFAA